MLDFIKADVHRVTRKKSMIVMTALVLVIYAATLIIMLKVVNASAEGIDLVSTLLRDAAVLLIGTPLFTAVFTDSFNSKSTQAVIGFGTSRRRLVVSRYCEYLVILALAFLAISLLSLVLFAVTGCISISGPLFKELWKGFLIAAMCVNVAIIFVYGAQNPTLGLVVFICLVANVFDLLLTGLSFLPFFADHSIDLSLILPSNLLYQAFQNGKPVFFLYALLGYIVLPLIISIKTFEKKELEF